MMNASERRDDTLIFAALAILWIIGSMALLGPVALSVAAVVMTSAFVFSLKIVGSLVISCIGAAAGILIWGPDTWALGPINTMIQIYREFLFDGHRFDFNGLGVHFGRMLWHVPAWPYFAPIGVTAAGLYSITWQIFTKSPLKRAAQGKRQRSIGTSFMMRRAKEATNQAPAATENGTLLGIARRDRKRIELSDDHANKHALVLGTVGSGKTVSVLNFVESGIDRQMPVIYVDGKGDYDLACQVVAYARARGRPAYLFAMKGESCIYNPLVLGGYSAKKDRIIELREWSEAHYREIAEGYLQLVFKVLEACDIEIDLVSVAEYLSFERLIGLISEQGDNLPDADVLLGDIEKRREIEEDVSSLRNQLWTLAESEFGHLFDTVDGPADAPILELVPAIEANAVVYFCLPALAFPVVADRIGKIVISDLKAYASSQLDKVKSERLPFYTIFDEFSVFAGEQVLNLIKIGRGAGVHALLATQSIADIGRAVTNGPEHFISQVLNDCNSYMIHRINAADDVTTIVETIGTQDAVVHTAQIDMLGSTGMGSARQTKAFKVHPDEIKELLTGEAVFVNKNDNTLHRLLVRHSAIDRAS